MAKGTNGAPEAAAGGAMTSRSEKIEAAARKVVSTYGYHKHDELIWIGALERALALPEDEAPKFPRAAMDGDEAAATVTRTPFCSARLAGNCTRQPGHDGDHITGSLTGQILARWPQSPQFPRAPRDAEEREAVDRSQIAGFCMDREIDCDAFCTRNKAHAGDHVSGNARTCLVNRRWPQSPQRWRVICCDPNGNEWPAVHTEQGASVDAAHHVLVNLRAIGSASMTYRVEPYPSPPPNTPAAAKGEREVVGWRVKLTRDFGAFYLSAYGSTKVAAEAVVFATRGGAKGCLAACNPMWRDKARLVRVTRKRRGGQ